MESLVRCQALCKQNDSSLSKCLNCKSNLYSRNICQSRYQELISISLCSEEKAKLIRKEGSKTGHLGLDIR
ncbi:hypothetical protein MERGE_002690 [Pneumocystis wakefieldiae]|uniref:Uncharacterized protein n=1 Tax=Pneumocystis wakefieldiae TaxID=38082 RepID=A0A899FN13_9ASCO|nr:hypothetical protein MERGE_002690 [Pneumocystis wakefieldiae]